MVENLQFTIIEEIGDLYPKIENGELGIGDEDKAEQSDVQLDLFSQNQSKNQNQKSKIGLTPVAYLWTRTVKCPNPGCGADGVLGFRVQPYGLVKWSDLFTSRQLLSLMTFVKWVRLAHQEMLHQGYEEGLAKAISTYLGILCDRLADYNSSITHWNNK